MTKIFKGVVNHVYSFTLQQIYEIIIINNNKWWWWPIIKHSFFLILSCSVWIIIAIYMVFNDSFLFVCLSVERIFELGVCFLAKKLKEKEIFKKNLLSSFAGFVGKKIINNKKNLITIWFTIDNVFFFLKFCHFFMTGFIQITKRKKIS